MGLNVTKKAEINVSADRLWSILADDFANVGQWARSVDSSSGTDGHGVPEGASVGGRVCAAPGFGDINESFLSFDAEKRAYSFEATATKIPSFVTNLVNNTSVKALGSDRSEVQMIITADLGGIGGVLMKPMMAFKFSSTLKALMADLTIYAESGNISAQKTKALAKAGR